MQGLRLFQKGQVKPGILLYQERQDAIRRIIETASKEGERPCLPLIYAKNRRKTPFAYRTAFLLKYGERPKPIQYLRNHTENERKDQEAEGDSRRRGRKRKRTRNRSASHREAVRTLKRNRRRYEVRTPFQDRIRRAREVRHAGRRERFDGYRLRAAL